MSSEIGDTRLALIDISDNHYFYEIKADYAKEMVTGFIRLNGMTVGCCQPNRDFNEEANLYSFRW